jgi:hypothetical protein
VSFENVVFYAFVANSDSNPDCSSDTSILQNGGFDTDFPPWTTSQGSSTSASFAVSGGQAIIQYAAGASAEDDEAQLSQSADIPFNTGYTITADLYVTLKSQGSCSVEFRNEFESLYNTGQISTTRELRRNLRHSFFSLRHHNQLLRPRRQPCRDRYSRPRRQVRSELLPLARHDHIDCLRSQSKLHTYF